MENCQERSKHQIKRLSFPLTRNFVFTLILLCLFRLLMTVGFIYDIPPIQHQGWLFHQGGDQIEYFFLAESFSRMNPIKSKYSIGFPLLLALLIKTARITTWQELVRPILIFHSILAISSIWIVAFLAKRVLQSTVKTLIATLVWVLHPLLMYIGFGLSPNREILRTVYCSHAMWFPILSDPLSAYAVLLGLLFFCTASHKKITICCAGLFLGIAALIRIPNAVIAFYIGFIFLIRGKVKELSLFAFCVILMLLPQFFYNNYCSGNPFKFGYASETEGCLYPFSLSSFIKGLKFTVLFFLLSISGIFYGHTIGNTVMKHLSMISMVYTLFYSFWWAFPCFPYRFLIPIIPIAFIVATELFIEPAKRVFFNKQ